jgi:Tfp pilus assembly protein PilF
MSDHAAERGTPALREHTSRRPRRSAVAWCILLAAATALVFSRAKECEFICFDDILYVNRNPALEAGLSARGIAWAFTTNLTTFSSTAEYWQPLTSLTRLADYEMHGFDASGHHLTSVLLHLAAGLALFGAFRCLTGSEVRSALVAGLFLLHPMHVEPVLWLSARKDVVNALFTVLTFWAYGRYAARPNWRRYGLVFLGVAAANMGKPMAVSLPFILLLLDVWPLRRFSFADDGRIRTARRLLVEKIPFFLLTAGVATLAYLVQKQIGAVAGGDWLPLWCRLGNAALGLVTYLGKAFVPLNLCIYYPHQATEIPVGLAILATLGLVALSAFAWDQRVRRPWLIAGWFWFLIMLAPVLGLVQIGEAAMADRYSYLAHVGIFAAVVWQGAEALEALARVPAPRLALALRAAPAVFLAWISFLAFQQVTTWRSSETVFRHALAVTSKNYFAHRSLGAVLLESGRREEAAAHLNEAMRLREPFLRMQLAAADAAEKRGDRNEAISRLTRILTVIPWHADLHHRLGNLLALNNEPGKALVQFDSALRYRPDWLQPRISMAVVLIGAGEFEKAERLLHTVLGKEPENPDANALLAMLPAEKKE